MKIVHFIASLLAMTLVSATGAENLNVFAAASLTESLKEIAPLFEAQTGVKLTFNFAASGTLARQIEEGAPADIFFSADEARADALEKKGLITARKSRLSNSLVVIVTADSTLAIASATDLNRPEIAHIALGEPKTVPIGTYAKEYLEKLKLWTAIQPKVVPCESVRAVLAAVESGNIEAGIVYKTDAILSKKVKVAFEIPKAEGPKVSYPMAMVTGSKHPESAKQLLDFLCSDSADKVFLARGFIVLKP